MSQFWLNFKKNCDFPDSEGPTIHIQTRFFEETNFFIVLVRVKCFPLYYTDFPPKQWIGYKFLKDGNSKNNQRQSTKSQKSLDKNKIKYMEQVCSKQSHDFLSWLLLSNTILPRRIL